MKKKTVMAIDDVTLNLMFIKTTLSNNFNVYIARSGKTALKMLEYADVDLFLLDINMPEMSGFAFLQNLKALKKYENPKVIILSSNDDKDTVLEALSYGVMDYISKPYEQSVLKEKVFKAFKV